MSDYKLSIALVTRNRPDLLETCLTSLFKQSKVWYEVLVSDDSSTPEFAIQNETIAQKFNVKYLKGPQRGLYANRNFVAKRCSGTHIRTMDDDHTFPERHFAICLEKIEEDPNSVWVIGEYNPTEIPSLKPPHPVPPEIHPRGFSTTPKDPQNSRAISCGASIYPKKIIDLNILNNEDFKFGSNYLEYGARLKYLGFRIRHVLETYVIHNFVLSQRSFNNEIESLDSNVYAILALSFIYEPTIKNKILTSSKLIYLLITDYKNSRQIILNNLKKIATIKPEVEKQRHQLRLQNQL